MTGLALTLGLLVSGATQGYPLDPACYTVQMDPPHYPAEEFRRGIHGVVTLEVGAKGCGHVDEVRVVGSSGNRFLDAAAVKRAWRWDMPFSLKQDLEPARWMVQVTFPVRATTSERLTLQAQYDATKVTVSLPSEVSSR